LKERRIKRFRYGFLYPLLGKLPQGLAYALAGAAPVRSWLVDTDESEAMKDNLRRVLGEELDTEDIIRKHFAMRAMENLDPYFLSKDPAEMDVAKFMEFRNMEVFERAHRQGRGVVLLIGHYGRVTMPFVGLGALGYTVGGVTIEIQNNPYIGAKERRHIQFKSDLIEKHSKGVFARVGNVAQLKSVYGLLKDGGVAYLAIDVFNNARGPKAPFLGGTITFPASILRLSWQNRSPVVGCFAYQEKGKLVVEFDSAPEPSGPHDYETLLQYVNILERRVLTRPQEYWLWPVLQHLWETD